jgi:hypothetical protein
VAPKSSPIAFVKLHRIHAAPQATRVEFSAPNEQTWRGEGGNPASKAAIAYRLALCWNVLEGIPTSKLDTGTVRDLCEAVIDGDLERARTIVRSWADGVDMTNGRPHDCKACLGRDDNDKEDREGESDE